MTADAPLQQRFGLTVTPQNVLGVRAVVLQEAQDLEKTLRTEREQVALPPLGRDLVSNDMSSAFNEATDQLLKRASEHVAALFKLGDELAATAREYGCTEADITTSFSENSPRTAASQVSPTFREIAGMGTTSARPAAQTISHLLTGGPS
ncbi:MAG TPA: hypothetical protein VL595_30080 [Pseudonocardia sp.]|jgi:hypothetical protein|nr:hypothetical protein [Pseudonocardia sp.]